MTTAQKSLAAQRLLYLVLAGVVLLSTLLLWFLRSGGGRSSALAVEHAADQAPRRGAPLELADARDAAQGLEREREALAPTAPASAPAADDAFDPARLEARLRCAGEPVAGAEVHVFREEFSPRLPRAPVAHGTSDADGRVRFEGMEEHGSYSLLVQHPSVLPEQFELFPGHLEELELEPAATVGGRVLAAGSGLPLAGVEVSMTRVHIGPAGADLRVRSVSDAEGRWQLPWADVGLQSFRVVRPGTLPERREFQVSAEGGSGYDILLDERAAVTLEVFALESGALLADTELLCEGIEVRTDSAGRLSVPLPPGGEDSVRIDLALPPGCHTQGRVNLAAGGTVRVPIAAGGTVRGRVIDADERPVAGAEVRISGGREVRLPGMPDGLYLVSASRPVLTDEQGAFVLAGMLPREGNVEARARHREHPPGRSDPFRLAPSGETADVLVRLAAGATLTGRVTLDGQPAPLSVHWRAGREDGRTRADDRGRYRLRALPSGEVNVAVRSEDEEPEVPRAEDRTVWLEDGQELTCDVDLASHASRIRGRVLDSSGTPVEDAELWLESEEEDASFELSAESASDGTFALSVPGGARTTYGLWVSSGPSSVGLEGIVPDGADLEIVLPELAGVSLRVRDALTREPVQGYALYWRESETGSFQRLDQDGERLASGPDGAFLAQLPCGRLDLCVAARSRGYLSATREGVVVARGETPELVFDLERGVELELVLSAAPGAEAALRDLRRGRVWIETDHQGAQRERGGALYQQEVRSTQTLRPDESGRVRMKALASGTYRFVGAKGFVFRPAEFELVGSQRVEAVLEPAPPKAAEAAGKRSE